MASLVQRFTGRGWGLVRSPQGLLAFSGGRKRHLRRGRQVQPLRQSKLGFEFGIFLHYALRLLAHPLARDEREGWGTPALLVSSRERMNNDPIAHSLTYPREACL